MSTRVKVKQMPKIDLNQERRRIAAMKSMVFEKKVKNAPKLDLAKNLLLKRRQLAVGSLRETEVSNDSPYSVKLESHMYSLQVTPV